MKRLIVFLILASLPASGRAAAAERLSLEDALRRAQASSARLRSLEAAARAAGEGVRGSRTGNRPEFEAAASYFRNSNVPELILQSPGAPPRTIFPNLPNNWRAHVGAALPLYTGGRVSNQVTASLESERATRADIRAFENDLALETRLAYVNVLLARETAAVLKEAIVSYDAHLKDAKDRYDLGLAASHEFLAVSAEKERADLGRVQAENAARLAEVNLARLVGAPFGASFELDAGLLGASSEPLAPEDGPSRGERAEIDALRARAKATDALADAALSVTRPQASLQASYDFANPNPRILPLSGAWNDTWSVGLSVQWKVFDGGRAEAASAQSRAQADALRAQISDLESRIALETETRRLELETAIAGRGAAARAIEAARDALRVARDRYTAGVLGSSERLDAETRLLRAQLEAAANEAQVQVARANLARARNR